MVSVVLLAGGLGSRMKESVPKQYMLLAGKPMFLHIIERLNRIEDCDEIILVCDRNYNDYIQNIIETYMIRKNIIFAASGNTRQESVYNGISKAKNDTILIHEAARPFVTENEFRDIICDESENVIFGYPIPYTVVKGDDYITSELNRNELVNVQLPQKFSKDILIKAHEKAKIDNMNFTEDASMIYHYFNIPIKIKKGSQYNLKITEPIDMIIGEVIYREVISRRK